MRRVFLSVLILTLLPASQLLAQTEQSDAAMQSIAPMHEMVKGYLIASAEQMPEELYNYRPTEEVRTFGQIIGHVANALHGFCGSAMGEGWNSPEDFEQRTTKDGLVEAIQMGFEACEAAYAMDDETAMEELEFFGQTGTRLSVLDFNNAHNWEHYGNLVVYFRANDMVPPSSQGGM
jgi:uncharacterized damage-inducible protein DinB